MTSGLSHLLPVCYRNFASYRQSNLTRIAENMVGSEVWQDASTLLIYQRKANTGAGAKMNLPDFATHEFVLQKEDIFHLTSNEQFFKTCAAAFQGIKNKDKEDEFGYETSKVLTKNFFYKTLLLGAYFGWDTLENFASIPPRAQRSPYIVAHNLHAP